MNRASLCQLLDTEGVSRSAYSLHPEPPSDETYCLDSELGGWMLYYRERGARTGVQHFDTEDEACRALLDLLLGDSTTRGNR